MSAARLLLIDNNPAFLKTTAKLLEPTCQVVATFVDGAEALRQVVRLKPDIILLDVSLGEFNGFEIVRRLRLLGLNAKIVFLSMHCHPEFVHAARQLGASGYIDKARTGMDLLRGIEAVAAGDQFFCEC